MSRHKLVKNLDLDDELDDLDGGEDYGEEGGEELSEEDQEQMRLGTIAVRHDLPPSLGRVTDKEIQEALWHYYYDIDKSVVYLENKYAPKYNAQRKEKMQPSKQSQGGLFFVVSFGLDICTAEPECKVGNMTGDHTNLQYACSKPFSFGAFFLDTPWLNVPEERRATLIAPLHPRGGLLGGASEGAPKLSKLQALAATRKKKAQEQKSNSSTGAEQPMASLSLSHSSKLSSEDKDLRPSSQKLSSRGFPIRKRKDSNPHEKAPRVLQDRGVEQKTFEFTMDPSPIDQAEPSAFASTMFSRPSKSPDRQQPENLFTLPYTTTTGITDTDPFAGPSPDDVVIAAQSKVAVKGKNSSARTNGEKRADQIASNLEALRIDDTSNAKSKNLDVLAEFERKKAKNTANFVVIGHVDAGKSTLMGRLLYDLNVVDQRTIDKYRKDAEKMGKSSFALAWVLDQGTEERSRGVTIDIAMNKFETEKTVFTILDAPGHRDFIPNMIAGASQADFAVLVIDASTGSFESGLKGQTKEHALLVRSMGVQKVIIAVNKLDTVQWSEERFNEIQNQISAFLVAAGFQSKNIAFIPCSGLHGDNIARRTSNIAASWYKGATLVEELDKSEPVSRALDKPLRLTIGDIFRGGVQNPLSVSGRIEAGSLQIGDALLSQPSGQKCFIKGLEVDSETVDWAVAGQNVTVHLSGIEEQYLKIGDVLCSPSSPVTNVKEFTVKVLAFEFLTPMQVDVHRGRLHTPGRIREISAVLDKNSGLAVGKKKARIVKPGAVARVVVEVDVEVPLEAPARIVLRSGGVTVGAGLLE